MNVNKNTKIAAILRDAKAKIFEETGVICNLSIVFSQEESTIGAFALFDNMCAKWGITPEWLRVPTRRDGRPMMRKLFWLAAKRKFPQLTYKTITQITCTGNHTTAVNGIEQAKIWISVNDSLMMSYYQPVAEYLEQQFN